MSAMHSELTADLHDCPELGSMWVGAHGSFAKPAGSGFVQVQVFPTSRCVILLVECASRIPPPAVAPGLYIVAPP